MNTRFWATLLGMRLYFFPEARSAEESFLLAKQAPRVTENDCQNYSTLCCEVQGNTTDGITLHFDWKSSSDEARSRLTDGYSESLIYRFREKLFSCIVSEDREILGAGYWIIDGKPRIKKCCSGCFIANADYGIIECAGNAVIDHAEKATIKEAENVTINDAGHCTIIAGGNAMIWNGSSATVYNAQRAIIVEAQNMHILYGGDAGVFSSDDLRIDHPERLQISVSDK